MPPTLLAQTPNARDRGRHVGHRFLVEPKSGVTAASAAALIDRCVRSADGAGSTWIGVSAAVVQAATGRPAVQTLMLCGVNTAHLSPSERQAIRDALHTRLAELETVVAGVDWGRVVGLTAEVPALSAWHEPGWRDLPIPSPPASTRQLRGRNHRVVLLSIGLLICAVAVGAVCILRADPAGPAGGSEAAAAGDQPKDRPAPKPPQESPVAQFLTQLEAVSKREGKVAPKEWDKLGKLWKVLPKGDKEKQQPRLVEVVEKWMTARVETALQGTQVDWSSAKTTLKAFEGGDRSEFATWDEVKRCIKRTAKTIATRACEKAEHFCESEPFPWDQDKGWQRQAFSERAREWEELLKFVSGYLDAGEKDLGNRINGLKGNLKGIETANQTETDD